MEKFSKKIADTLQWVMNIGLLAIGILLSLALVVETKEIVMEGLTGSGDYKKFIEEILVFFLYFEFGESYLNSYSINFCVCNY